MNKVVDTLQEIKDCIDAKQSFKLEAGAGSGKTWSLVESLKYILNKNGKELAKENRKIACITYTNAAADEIHDRIDNNPLVFVGTIHKFLWSIIGRYTNELKQLIIEYNSSVSLDRQVSGLAKCLEKVEKIEYNLYKKDYATGQIWHNDVIRFSKALFAKRRKLALMTVNQCPYIFVDEYQDTFPDVVNLLLDDIYLNFQNKVIIGFFGDSMQNIYDTGIGRLDLTNYPDIKEITKYENFRCSKRVIELLKHIRPELEQYPAGRNKEGEVSFYYGSASSIEILKKNLKKKGWNFEDRNRSKILYLTHRRIAEQGGYSKLLEAFPDRERFFERNYMFSRLLFEIEDVCRSYEKGDYANLFIRLKNNEFKILKHEDKKKVRIFIEKLSNYRNNKSIQETLNFIVSDPIQVFQIQDYLFFMKNVNSPDLDEETAINKNIFNSIKGISFKEVSNAFDYIEENTLYSTKHGVKGREYENVLVVVDDTAWNNFSDNDVFSHNNLNTMRYNRSRNLLYVCCSRAKNKLVLLAVSTMNAKAQRTILEWFGKNNVYRC